MNKASGGDEIPAELFEIIKDDAIKVLHSNLENLLPANLENSAVARGLEKVNFHSNPKEGQAKECSDYCKTVHISHARQLMLKFLQARHQQYVNQELPDIQAGFRKDRRTRDQIANIRWIMEKGREFQKYIYFCFIDYAKAFDCVDHNTLLNKEIGILDT